MWYLIDSTSGVAATGETFEEAIDDLKTTYTKREIVEMLECEDFVVAKSVDGELSYDLTISLD